MVYDPFAPGLYDATQLAPAAKPLDLSRGAQRFTDNFVNSFLTDTWGGQLVRRANIAAAMDGQDRYPAPSENWNPLLDADIKGYEQFAGRFMSARSPFEVDLIKRQIDENLIAKRELDYGGAGVSRFLSSVVDPINLVPLPGMAGVGLVRGALRGGTSFLALGAASELARYSLDPTATGEEFVANVAGNALFGAALGAPLGRFGRYHAAPVNTPPGAKPGIPFAEIRHPEAIDAAAAAYHDGEGLRAAMPEDVNVARQQSPSDLGFAALGAPGLGKAIGDNFFTTVIDRIKADRLTGTFATDPLAIRLAPEVRAGRVTTADEARAFLADAAKGEPATRAQIDRVMAMPEADRAAYTDRLFAAMEQNLKDPEGAAIRRHLAGLEQAAKRTAEELDRVKEGLRQLEAEAKAAPVEGGARTKAEERVAHAQELLAAAEGSHGIAASRLDRARRAATEARGAFDDYMLKSTRTPLEGWMAASGQFPWHTLVNNGLAGPLARRVSLFAHKMVGSPGLLTRGLERGVAPPSSAEYAAKIWHQEADLTARAVENEYLKYLGYEQQGRLAYAKETLQQAILDPLAERLGRDKRLGERMRREQFQEAVGAAVIGKGNHANPFVNRAAVAINEFNKRVLADAKELGIFRSQESMTRQLDYVGERIGYLEKVQKEHQAQRDSLMQGLDAAAKGKFEPLQKLYGDAVAAAQARAANVSRETRIEVPPAEYDPRVKDALSRVGGEPKAGDERAIEAAARRNVTAGERTAFFAMGEHEKLPPAENRLLATTTIENAAEAGLAIAHTHTLAAVHFPAGMGHLEFSGGTFFHTVGGRIVKDARRETVVIGGVAHELQHYNWRPYPPAGEITAKKAVAWAERRLGVIDGEHARLEGEIAQHTVEQEGLRAELASWQARGGDDKPEWYFHTLYNREVIARKRDVLEAKLVEHFRQNPFTYVNGKKLQLATDRASLLRRAKETVDTILRRAEFQNGLDNLDVRPPGEKWQETATRLREGAAELRAAGRTEQALIAERRAKFIEEQGRQGKLFGTFGQSSPLLGRKLDVPRSIFLDAGDGESFIHTRADMVQEHYVNRMAPAIEMARAFGDNARLDRTFNELKDALAAHILEMSNHGTPAEIAAAVKKRDELLQAFMDVRDKVLGNFGIGENPASWTRRAASAATNWASLAQMGKAWLSAVTDLPKITMTEGIGRTFGYMFDAFRQRFSSDKELERWVMRGGKEVEQSGAILEVARGTRAANLAGEGEHFTMMNKAERLGANLGKWGFIVNLLGPWTDMMKRFGGGLVQSRILEDSIAIARGEEIPKWRRTLLAQAGIDENLARSIAREWERAGGETFQGSWKHPVYLSNAHAWQDAETRRTFLSILGQQIDNVVISPGAADRPNFMYGPAGKLMFQYRQYSMSATQRILMASLQRDDKQRLSGLLAMVATGFLINALRAPDYAPSPVQSGFAWDKRFWGDLGSVLYRSVELSGITGIFTDLNNAIETATGNSVGIRPALGIPPMLKEPSWAQQVGAVSGPASTLLMQAVWAFSSPDAHSDDRARAFRYLLPFNNNWLWSDFFDRVQRGLAGSTH